MNFRREVQAVFQDPYEVYNPFYRVDHVLKTPIARFRLAASRAEDLALLKVEARTPAIAPFRSGADLRPGDAVVAFALPQ